MSKIINSHVRWKIIDIEHYKFNRKILNLNKKNSDYSDDANKEIKIVRFYVLTYDFNFSVAIKENF